MILSDRDIRARLTLGDLVIEPLANPELQLQPARHPTPSAAQAEPRPSGWLLSLPV